LQRFPALAAHRPGVRLARNWEYAAPDAIFAATMKSHSFRRFPAAEHLRMEIEIQLTDRPIAEKIFPPPRQRPAPRARGWNFAGSCGARKTASHPRARIRSLSGNGRARNPAAASGKLAVSIRACGEGDSSRRRHSRR
jgi:hypothetical protein